MPARLESGGGWVLDGGTGNPQGLTQNPGGSLGTLQALREEQSAGNDIMTTDGLD